MRVFPSIVLFVVCVVSSGCGGPRELQVPPDDLIGIWKTTEGRYSKRFLEVSADEVVLGVRDLELDRFAIRRVDLQEGDRVAVYRIHYVTDEGYPDHLALSLQQTPELTLQIGNIPFQWRPSDTR